MRLLDRYLLRELCVPLIYCLAGFLIFWISFDLFGDLEDFQNAKLTAGEVARYYMIKTPELLVTVLPVALLLALLFALTNHGRHNEIIAMRAAGLSLARISVPYVAIGLLLSLVLFFLNEALVPDSSQRAEAIKKGHPKQAEDNWQRRVNFRNARENRIWNISALNSETFELIGPDVDWRLPDGSRKQITAQRGARTNDQWVFYDVELYSYPPNVDFDLIVPPRLKTNRMVFPEFSETPADVMLQLKFQHMNAIEASKRTQLSLGEIRYLREHLELNQRDEALLETQFHARLAQPWMCLVVALVALPFGANTNSRRNVVVGVASSIFIVFIYFVLLRIGLAFGIAGKIPPWAAGWAPNALFTTLALWLTWKIK